MYNDKTFSYHQSMETVDFRYYSDDHVTLLESNNNYFRPFRYVLEEEILPDQRTYIYLSSCPKEVVEGMLAYCMLRRSLNVAYMSTSPAVARETVRPVWIPDTGCDINPPEHDYVKIVRGKEWPAKCSNYWVEMIGLLDAASKVSVPGDVKWMNLEELDAIFPPMEQGMKYVPIVVEPVVESKFAITESEPLSEDKRESYMHDCSDAALIISQLPIQVKTLYVSPDMAAWIHVLTGCQKRIKIGPVDEAECGIYPYFPDLELHHTPTPMKQVVVLSAPQLPSPSGYENVGAFRGRVHVKGFKVQLFHKWDYTPSPSVDLYVDCLRPHEVYAANTLRGKSYMRVVRNMGYDNYATSLIPHVEYGFKRHTWDAVELVDTTIHTEYAGHIDLNTGKRFVFREGHMVDLLDRGKISVYAGTVLYSDYEIIGRLPYVRVVRGTTTTFGWLVMRGTRIKIYRGGRFGAKRFEHVIVSVKA